jgi:hypothetical protein
MKKHNLILILVIGLIFVSMFVFQGCQNKLEGIENQQVAPSIYWADVTIDTSYSANPNLRWFSTDQDGLVIDYQYCVILASTVDSLGGAEALLTNFPTDRTWSIIHKDSSTIQLYASPDTSVYVPQYVFLRAMDDDSLFSSIIYKYVRRNNHAPTCYLILPTSAQWCLPETTTAWKGIRAAWVGKDSVDITGLQPDFQWNIRIYGPFVSQPALSDTLGTYSQPGGADWILKKELKLQGLVTGYYLVYATCRDDAFVSAIPARGVLQVFEPTWIRHPEQTKDILLADHGKYPPTQGPSFFPYTSNDLMSVYRDSVNMFYRNLIEAAGITPDQYDTVTYTRTDNFELPVQKSMLYNHRLVIINDIDITSPLANSNLHEQEGPYSEYLAVGGMIWIVGRRSFDSAIPGRQEFGLTGDHSIAFSYFNINAIFSPPLTNLFQAEFIGASSLVAGFPDLAVDTMKVRQSNWYQRSSDQDPGPDTLYYYIPHLFSNALPGVDFLLRQNNSEALYKYIAVNPDTSSFHNFPVAMRYNPGSYKTAYFSFPLYFIQYDQALQVTTNMLDWFLREN